ncbi:hypothetical protein [Sphingomonas sp. TREG-RG-20F-R18-01]|uniref:hypothetical protein n=1 Tax=Sphingomonas sp. TREG-RG-20F-R18-01 TaxID=2914982 RepID=UPI001F580F8F|nr:hypothetical protein [Sphingomonas sp. TREG-RG-20F-R18-01]
MWWAGMAGALAVAVLAGVADWRRSRRDDLDRVGWFDWRTVQMTALLGAALCVIAAQH